MAAFNKFDIFVQDVAHKQHDLSADALKVFLTNVTPAATDTVYDGTTGSTGPAEITAANGYTAGGIAITTSTSSQTSGTYTLVVADPSNLTASGGSIGPFRYSVLYNSANSKLIGWWDYGSSISLADGDSFAQDFDQVNGVLSIA